MPGYQPRLTTDHVWVNGTDIHDFSLSTGLGVRVTEMRGWDERPDVRDVRETRSGQDGEYADNLYLGGRTITLMGAVHGSSWVDLQARKRALAVVFQPSSSEVLLKVPDPATASPTGVYASTGMTGYERASVRVVEPLTFGDMIGSRGMTWQVVVRASDPRIYSDVETSTDSGTTGTATRTVTVDQAGTYKTPVTMTVTGTTGAAWSISDSTSGLTLSFPSFTLASTDTVDVNVQNRSVRFNTSYQGVRLKYPIAAGWLLNETSGTTADNYQGTATYDLTYTGGFTLNQGGPGSGLASVALNGSTGYLTTAYNAALIPAQQSVEVWVYLSSLSGTQTVADMMSYNGSSYGGYQLVVSGGRFGVNANGTVYAYGPALSTGVWYHLVASFDDNTDAFAMYLNGSSILSATSTFPRAATDAVQFGRSTLNGSNSNYLNGRIGPAAIYSAILSSVQVTELYAANAAASSGSAYSEIDASTALWADLAPSSSTFSLASTGLTTGSKLNVKYRDARI